MGKLFRESFDDLRDSTIRGLKNKIKSAFKSGMTDEDVIKISKTSWISPPKYGEISRTPCMESIVVQNDEGYHAGRGDVFERPAFRVKINILEGTSLLKYSSSVNTQIYDPNIFETTPQEVIFTVIQRSSIENAKIEFNNILSYIKDNILGLCSKIFILNESLQSIALEYKKELQKQADASQALLDGTQ